jgi:hypothetical protein
MTIARALRISLWIAIAAATASATPALACRGDKVLFADDFTTVNPAWSVDEHAKIGGGVMKIVVANGDYNIAWNDALVLDKADLCVEVTETTAEDASAGIIFAAADDDHYYLFYVYPTEGYAGVSRVTNDRSDDVIAERKIVVSGNKARLRLTLFGARAVAYIDDKQFADFKVEAPKKGGGFGLTADSPDDATATWEFRDFKTTNVAGAGQN